MHQIARHILSLVSVTLMLASTGMARAAEPEPPKGFRAILNGKDLTGWHGLNPHQAAKLTGEKKEANLAKQRAEFPDHWTVENGELVNDGHGPYAATDEEFGDMELLLEYKTVAKADSGIYLRETPQVQIWDYTEAGGKWNIGADKGSGGLWNNKNNERFPPACYDQPFGEWNRMSIMIIGERVWVTLNNHTTVNGVRMENYWDRTKPMPKQGRLQLQTHGGEIRFRNMSVRVLDGESANQFLASSDFHAYMPAFNGTDFTGWQGATDNYEIVDGAIRCKQGKGGNLFTNEVYQDFSVRCQFKVPPGGNKYANLKPYQYHGSAYGMAPALRGYQRPVGQWNFQEVTMIGSRVTVELNGFLILDADLKDLKSNLPKHVGKDNAAGHFGFCGHNDAVSFRDIRIRGL